MHYFKYSSDVILSKNPIYLHFHNRKLTLWNVLQDSRLQLIKILYIFHMQLHTHIQLYGAKFVVPYSFAGWISPFHFITHTPCGRNICILLLHEKFSVSRIIYSFNALLTQNTVPHTILPIYCSFDFKIQLITDLGLL